MTAKLFVLLNLLSLLLCQTSLARLRIPVGAYVFAPYYEIEAGTPTGLTVEAVHLLNKLQGDFEFVITELSPNRRYQLFKENKIEMMFFEDPAWNWNRLDHYSLPLGFKDDEIFFSTSKKARKPGYFNDLKKRRLVGLLGYHYHFAGLNADENYLKSHYQIQLVNTYEASLRFVLSDRADIGLATRSFMNTYFRNNPRDRAKILVAEKPDQTFNLSVILSKHSQIPKHRLEFLIEKLQKHPEFQRSLMKFGFKEP